MKKKILIMLLILLVVFVGGCVEQGFVNNKNLESYYDNSFFVEFNDQINNELVASISNKDFQSYFSQDLELLNSDIDKVEDFILEFHLDSNLVYVKIEYTPNLTEKEKYVVLNRIIELMKEKWYVKYVNYNFFEMVVN